MDVLKRIQPYIILGGALLLFVLPVFFNRTLTNFSDIYAISPWSGHQPAGWFHSNSIDATPILFFNPSDLLNRELLRAGEAFAWNPYVGFGTPWLGAMQSAPYFPAKLISMLWPGYWKGQDAMLVLMLLVAGLGNFLLLRSLGVTREGATFGGLAYMFCQRLFLIINMPAFTIESMVPLMLYAVSEMMKRKSIGFAVFAGGIGGAQFLAGFPETSFMFALVSGLFFLWLLWLDRRSLGKLKHGIVLGTLVLLVTIALSGFQLAEFAKFVSLAQTTHNSNYGTVVKEPFWLLPLFLPNFFGTPLQSYWIAQVGPNDHMPPSLFCGISTVWLAIMALIWRAAPNRHCIWFFAVLFIVFTGYEYGFPLVRYVGYLPLVNLMSIAWSAFVIPFTLSVLAGFGVQSLRQDGAFARLNISLAAYAIVLLALLFVLPTASLTPAWPSFVPLLYVVPIFIAAFLLMRRVRWMGIGAVTLFALITLESYLCVRQFDYLHYYGPSPAELPSLAWLERNVGHDRIFGLDGIYPADMLVPSRLRDIRHFDALYSKLYVDYAGAIWPGAHENVYQIGNLEWKTIRDPLLDLAGVKYVVTKGPYPETPEGLTEVYSDSDATIYRSDGGLPRARFVSEALSLPAGFDPSALKNIIGELKTGVVLEGRSGPQDANRCDTPSSAPVDFVEDDVGQITMKVVAPCSGFVVLADLFYPGWTAAVDGKVAPIYKANYAFRAIAVGAGIHEIVLNYRPWTTRIGIPLAFLTFVGLLGAALYAGYRRRLIAFRGLVDAWGTSSCALQALRDRIGPSVRRIENAFANPKFDSATFTVWVGGTFLLVFHYAGMIRSLGWNAMEFIITNNLWAFGRYATGINDPTALWRPAFPTFVLLIVDRLFTDPLLAFRVLAALSLSIFVGSMYYAGRLLGGAVVANIGAALALTCPAITIMLLNHPHSLSHLVLAPLLGWTAAVSLTILNRPADSQSKGMLAIVISAGVLWGLCCTTRSEALLWAAIFFVFCALQLYRRQQLPKFAILLVAFAAVVLPHTYWRYSAAATYHLLDKPIYQFYNSQGWADPRKDAGPDVEKEGYLYAIELYGTPQENSESMFQAILHNPHAFEQRVSLNYYRLMDLFWDNGFLSTQIRLLMLVAPLAMIFFFPQGLLTFGYVLLSFFAVGFLLVFHIDERYITIAVPFAILLALCGISQIGRFDVSGLCPTSRTSPPRSNVLQIAVLGWLVLQFPGYFDSLKRGYDRQSLDLSDERNLSDGFLRVAHLSPKDRAEARVQVDVPLPPPLMGEDGFMFTYFSHTSFMGFPDTGYDVYPRDRIFSWHDCSPNFRLVPAGYMLTDSPVHAKLGTFDAQGIGAVDVYEINGGETACRD